MRRHIGRYTQRLSYAVRTERTIVCEPFHTLQERLAWAFQYIQIHTGFFFFFQKNTPWPHDFYQIHKELPTTQTWSVHLLAGDTLTHGSHREHKKQQLCPVSFNVVFTAFLLRLEGRGKSSALTSEEAIRKKSGGDYLRTWDITHAHHIPQDTCLIHVGKY